MAKPVALADPEQVVERIRAFNQGRESERLALKYQIMRRDSFAFLRGTAHLFHGYQIVHEALPECPVTWICGDVHLENFGSYKGDNRLTYFDLNDFDEACLGPVSRDLLRLLASVHVVTANQGFSPEDQSIASTEVLKAYGAALATGKSRWIERATARGLVRKLLRDVKQRARADFLAARLVVRDGKPRLRVDSGRALRVDKAVRTMVGNWIEAFAAQRPDAGFFRVRDVARRVAGLATLGTERYVVLVEGRGGPAEYFLLDLKRAYPSTAAAQSAVDPPHWASDAERITVLQAHLQAVPPAMLCALETVNGPFVLRELQPSEDRVDLSRLAPRNTLMAMLLKDAAELLAWAHLRSAARRGAHGPDTLIAFGASAAWHADALAGAARLADQVARDWHIYAAAFDAGAFRRTTQ